jgi:transcriptional regulator GlxA family with amidase domain
MHVQGTDVDELVSVIVGESGSVTLQPNDVYSVTTSIEEAVTALERDDTDPMLYIAAGAAWRVLAQLASERLRGPAQTSDRIDAVQNHLRTHLTNSFSVAELARLAGLSVSHFSALFKESAGIGVVAYVNRLRCARAGELLITTESSIAEIAAAVGYADAFYFSRQFRALNGISPRAFRQRSRGEAF